MSEPVWVPIGAAGGQAGLFQSYAHFRDEKPINTNGGTPATANTWGRRDLNTLMHDSGVPVALAGNQFTLPAGTYFIYARVPGYKTGHAKARLYNATDAVQVLLSNACYSQAGGDYAPCDAIVQGRFTLPAAKTLEIQMMVGTVTASTGFGVSNGFTGLNEVYTEVRIYKEFPVLYPVPAAVVLPFLTTTLPGSPADGQECILTDSLTAGTYHWRLRYVAARATNKWVFVGGAPGFSEIATSETSTSLVYAALATPGPSFTIPVAGDYLVDIGWEASSHSASGASAAYMSYDIGATAAVDADSTISAISTTSVIGEAGIMRRRRKSLAAVALVSKYKVSGNTIGFQKRWMSVEPVAVGG